MVRPMTQDNNRPDSPKTSGLFTAVRRTRSSDEVVGQIRQAILDDRLKTGDRLPSERELCRMFDVSRGTLREALRTLEAFGAIAIRPGAAGGIFVSEPRGDQVGAALEALMRFRRVTVDELAEFRVSFEGESAQWAAERATAEDVERLFGLAQQFAELAGDKTVAWPVFVELDLDFHRAIAEASKNQVRVAIMLGIHAALSAASSSLSEHSTVALRKSIARELHGIASAVQQRDAALAATRMRRHVKKFSDMESAIQKRAR